MSPSTPRAPDPASLRRVVLPTEHGGWSFLGEPILLGLLVAFSAAGVLAGVAAAAGFLARQPLRLFVADRRRGRVHPRTRAAERACAVLAALGGAALAAAVALARGPLLVALLPAAPFAAVGVAADLARHSRAAIAELSGALALGAVAAAIALAGGVPPAPAFGLWGVLAARAVSTVFYVRARLRLERGDRGELRSAALAQVAALLLIAVLAAAGRAHAFAIGAIVLLALRAALGLSRWRLRATVAVLGASEVAFGLVTVLAAWADVTRSGALR